MPLFWSDEENISPVSRKYLRVYLLWIFYKYLALCYYWDAKEEDNPHGWLIFLLAGYWYTCDKLAMRRSFTMFWIISKDFSLILWSELWKASVDNIDSPDLKFQQKHLLVYVIPLFYMFHKYGDTPYRIFAMFYLFHKRLSLIYIHLKHNENWGYILPLIYIVLIPEVTIVKAIFIPTVDYYGIALIDYKKRKNNDSVALWKLHVHPWFYTYERKTVDQIVDQKENFIFWFLILRELSLIQYWFLRNTNGEESVVQ